MGRASAGGGADKFPRLKVRSSEERRIDLDRVLREEEGGTGKSCKEGRLRQ